MSLEFGVRGLGFQASGLVFWVLRGFGFRVSGFGFRVSGLGFRVSGFVFGASCFRFPVSGSGWMYRADRVEAQIREQQLDRFSWRVPRSVHRVSSSR